MEKAERQEMIEKYGRAWDDFLAGLKQIPKEAWLFKPAPAEWSVHQVIIHLADSETNSYLRARRLLADPQFPLMAYDQDEWANKLDYHSQSTDDALVATGAVRRLTYNMIKNLPDEAWEITGIHPEYSEPYKFTRWLKIYSNHPYDHLGQIQENYRLWKEQGGK